VEATWWTRPDQLDDEQKDVVALPLDGNHLIIGPPGSGKTNLLLLRATYLQRNRINNFQILTLGRVLREFLASGTKSTRISEDKIDTFMGWSTGVLYNAGVEFKRDGKLHEQRADIADKLLNLPDDVVDEYRLDAILLDECQDYMPEEIEVVRKFANRIFAAGDSRQRIYQQKGGIERLRQLCPSVKELTYHYRSGSKICRVADGITNKVGSRDGMEAFSQYKEREAPSQVTFYDAESLDDQVARAVALLQSQLRAYPAGLLGILCPLTNDVKAVWTLLGGTSLRNDIQLQLGENGYASFDPERRIMVGTVHGSKGLEFRALHLMAMEGLERFMTNRTRIAYTGVTRAKTSLSIYRSATLIGPLQNGEAALAPPPGEVTLESLFS
jgi:superfamily I DNA/RNA helicase